jgi:protein SCO1/2
VTSETAPPRKTLRRVQLLLWILVALAVIGTAALLLIPRLAHKSPVVAQTATIGPTSFGGPFTLVGADGKPFSSAALAGKPYALYFGYTLCGDVCPTTLARLAKLRQAAGGEQALNIVFITIDPANDGPRQVGQYASLFNSPIIGLTGSPAQIDQVKKQYGIYANPEPMAPGHAMTINHTATVLLFGRDGKFAATIATDEPDSSALAKLKRVTA